LQVADVEFSVGERREVSTAYAYESPSQGVGVSATVHGVELHEDRVVGSAGRVHAHFVLCAVPTANHDFVDGEEKLAITIEGLDPKLAANAMRAGDGTERNPSIPCEHRPPASRIDSIDDVEVHATPRLRRYGRENGSHRLGRSTLFADDLADIVARDAELDDAVVVPGNLGNVDLLRMIDQLDGDASDELF
jgi:hypothetical protein